MFVNAPGTREAEGAEAPPIIHQDFFIFMAPVKHHSVEVLTFSIKVAQMYFFRGLKIGQQWAADFESSLAAPPSVVCRR